MPVGRYLVVDEQSTLIVGGPYQWDGVTPWTPFEQGTVMLEADALALGYSYPPPPDTTWAVVDEANLLILSTFMWNGVGDPPEPGVLMTEQDAVGAGYSYV